MADLTLVGLVIGASGEYFLQNLLNGTQSDAPPVAPDLVGVDLCASTRGLHRVFQTSGSVYCQTVGPAATGWETPVLVSEDAATDSVPTIACAALQDELLLCAFHAEDDDTLIYRSPDHGTTWALHATFGGRFPRVAAGFGKIALVNWSSDSLFVWMEENLLTSLSDPVLEFAADEQLAALYYTWQGWLVVVYEGGGVLFNRASVDGGTEWSAEDVSGSGRKPTAANGFPDTILAFWTGGVGSETSEVVTDSGVPIPEQYTGVAIRGEDAFGVAADEDGAIHTFWSAGVKADWLEVV